MKERYLTKKFSHVLICMMILGMLVFPGRMVASAHSYSGNYQKWSQGGSDDAGMREYGCWVVAQAKLLYETNVDRSASFHPDSYFNWQRSNGYIDSGYYQTDGASAPVVYAQQKGRNLEYLGYWDASDDQLWWNINAGYYTILNVSGHYVMIANELSKSRGQLYCYDSWYTTGECEPQPITRYSQHLGGYVYRSNGNGGTGGSSSIRFVYQNLRVAYIDDWNATISADISNPDRAHVSQVGAYIWDSTGKKVVDHTEAADWSIAESWQSLNVVAEALPSGLQSGETYICQFWANANNQKFYSDKISFTILDEQAPVISKVKISNITEDSYTVSCTVTDNYKVDRVIFCNWTTYNGKDDLAENWETNTFYRGTQNGNTYTYTVKRKDHNDEYGIYEMIIYAYDKAGNEATDKAQNVILRVDDSEEEEPGTGTEDPQEPEQPGTGTEDPQESEQPGTSTTPQTPLQPGTASTPKKPSGAVTSAAKQLPVGTAIKNIAGGNYKVTGTNTVAFTKPAGKKSSVYIPTDITVNGVVYRVTSIAANAFKNDKKLKKVTIGAQIQKIGANAFRGCKNLKQICVDTKQLKKSRVGKKAFAGISKKVVFRIVSSKVNSYKKIFRSKGAPSTAKYKIWL